MNILKEIKDLIHEYPSDQKLGNVIRGKYKNKELYEDQGDGHMIGSHLIDGRDEYGAQEDWVCEYCKKSTYHVDLDYIGNYTNHLSCELEHEISHDVDTEIDLDRDIP